jgi:acyl-phosphate glycerol 3-phosphate acyltransferase
LAALMDSAPLLTISLLVGYLFGSLPLADRISRRRGVDIFASGTGLAGASNVRRSVGKYTAGVVLLGDLAKGVLAVISARVLGIDDAWIILVATATVVGHWHSVFAGFRGGDGLATLGGIVIALFPLYGLIAAVVATAVALGAQKAPYTSLMGIVFGYTTLAALGFAYELDLGLILGIGGLVALVLARATKSNLRRRRFEELEEYPDAIGATEQPRS